ncbi:MAG TPA: methyltransferase domain-containing protein [Candidatus Dormibacteraeota bacterium]|nr:methyltransferase domain-containing protein [Candidatus Dormibacteraeota bacterium]
MNILKQAGSFTQYNIKNMDWIAEWSATSPTRNFMRRAIALQNDEVRGVTVLDVGCGMGWFLEECLQMGAERVYGIEPSNLADLAQKAIPKAHITRQTFEDYDVETSFGLISFIMSIEHMPDIDLVLSKASKLLSATGEILILAADYDRFQEDKYGNVVTKEIIKPGKEMAVRIERPQSYGTTNDILRTVNYWKELFKKAALKIVDHKTVLIDKEYVAEEPKRSVHLGHPIFQLFRLEGANAGGKP